MTTAPLQPGEHAAESATEFGTEPGTKSGIERANRRAAALGQITAILMSSPRHAGMTMADLAAGVAPAVGLGQFAVLVANRKDGGAFAGAAATWWALVSPEVEAGLTDCSDPFLKLKPSDWTSGDQPILMDVIGDSRTVNELLKQLLARNFMNLAPKLRAVLPDGRVTIGKLHAKPSG